MRTQFSVFQHKLFPKILQSDKNKKRETVPQKAHKGLRTKKRFFPCISNFGARNWLTKLHLIRANVI